MVGIIRHKIILRAKCACSAQLRGISKYLDKDISSRAIRKRFLDYFIDSRNHTFVKSSPVVPFCDPTVAFVNAGMNQFKGIFLGNQKPVYKRVVNSQKCVRVGGKHNDLNVVGTDGFHHTFFEMLGNWSFGDYFKKEACDMAWTLLTNVYKINKQRLYVTYFAGDEKLGLKPDLECVDIWKSIGVPSDRIKPFGPKDNFWEMGLTGPCGPCTEIHIDHLGTTNRAVYVNKGLFDLTELWNLVFIQYNREMNGEIKLLPEKHIDTGMGFERLTAILQGEVSNYNTDIFEEIFKGIQRACRDTPKYEGKFGERDWNHLDTSYRILADHARMITACLSDGMIPEQNQKLRRVMRKAFQVCKTNFKHEKGLLKEISNYVVENLGSAYPEMEKNIKQVHAIIDYEEEIFASLQKKAFSDWEDATRKNAVLSQLEDDVLETPSLVNAYKEILQNNIKKITPEIGFKLYDTFGLDEDSIAQLAKCLTMEFDVEGFKIELEKAKHRSKELNVFTNKTLAKIVRNYGKTEDTYKYNYRKSEDEYVFDDLEANVIKIVKNNEIVSKVAGMEECALILDKTNFYSEAGGQICDVGTIEFKDGRFQVSGVENVDGCLLHRGIFVNKRGMESKLTIGAKGTLMYDKNRRLELMKNHTSVHLLNVVLKKYKGSTCQKSSKVTDKYMNLDVGVFGDKLSQDDLKQVEEEINQLIKANVDVEVRVVDSQRLYDVEYLTLIPGEVYPMTGIRVVRIDNFNIFSREPCCGTHVVNTGDIEQFCFIGAKSLGRSTTSLHGVSGERAKLAVKNGSEVLEDVEKLRKTVADNIDSPDVLNIAIMALKQRLSFELESQAIIPYLVKVKCLQHLDEINKQIKDTAKNNLKEFIEMEMQNIIKTKKLKAENNKEFLVHYLRTSMILDSVPLQRATKMCPDIPVLVIAFSDNLVKARCCVPKEYTNPNFNAEKWIAQVTKIFRSPSSPPKGQDPQLVCNMKAKKVNTQDWDTLLTESVNAAKLYAQRHL